MSNYSSFSPNDIETPETFSTDVYKYVKGDTGPQLRITLTDEDTGTATDLTGATVLLNFRPEVGGPALFTKTLYVNPEAAESIKGIAIINWAAGDLDQTPGIYHGEIEVTRASGVKETLYDILRFKIRDEFA
jgi:hypothetical protein